MILCAFIYDFDKVLNIFYKVVKSVELKFINLFRTNLCSNLSENNYFLPTRNKIGIFLQNI